MTVSGLLNTLKNTNFVKLWLGQVVSNLGDEVAFFSIAVMVVFYWNGSAVDLSIVMIASSLPILLFGSFAGVFVDRWNKRYTMVVADLLRAFLALLFIFCTSVIQLSVVVFLISFVSRFFYPARVAIIPELLSDENLVEANSLSQLTYMISVIFGPVIGTSMIYLFGYFWIFVFDSLTYIFSAVSLMLLSYSPKAHGKRKRPLLELKEGFSYILTNPTVKLTIAVFSFMMLFLGGMNVVYSIYVRDVIHMGVAGYGFIEVMFGIGTIAGSVIVGVLTGRVQDGRLIMGGMLILGVVILMMGAFPVPVIAIIMGGLLVGIAIGFINAPATGVLQRVIPEEFRGRVFGVQGTLIQGVSLLSMVVMGLLVTWVGVLPVIFVSGIIVTAFSLALFLHGPTIKKLSGEDAQSPLEK